MVTKKFTASKATSVKKQFIELEIDLSILAVDSNFEQVTKAAYEYRQEYVYPYLEAKGFKIVRCQGFLARRIYVAPEAARDATIYITGVGHGSYTTYTGDYFDPIFDMENYQTEEVAGKVVHLLSCRTAASLGPDLVLHGCRAYFGYDENFTFIMKFSEIFFECDSAIDLRFADGLSAREVFNIVIELFDQRISELESAGHDYVASVLEYNRDHLRSPSVDARWGDPMATIG